ncbi:hypothetical protein [Mesorhizobium sp. ES1-1]|uniref:hypothetical protein n=1 Tax=Mesorhizobium sp. ES1-1 TaxID=2876629 RepID=UPI001CC9F64C|nr:hypothetical protein [Mesorhizobium sp. ES1-1]MBZ9677694.1 hypothetical protein [Mesorhizobium sp. ES1-1]
MLFAFVGVAIVSLLVGLTLRAPALIVVTLVVILVSIIAGSVLQLSLRTTVGSTLCLVLVTQVFYLIGLAIGLLRHRAR